MDDVVYYLVNSREKVDLNINGYKYIDPVVNIGFLAVYMALLPLFHVMISFSARCHFLRLNLWKAYRELFVDYQIVFLMSSVIYMV